MENRYYPFGLTMAGISSRAEGKPESNKKFQGQEFAHKEFSDGSGLEMYEFKYRMDDPQTGRFWQIDPLASKYVYNSTYAFSENKVTSNVELEGLETGSMMYSVPVEKAADVIKGANEVYTPVAKGIAVAGVVGFSLAFPQVAGPIVASYVFGVPSPSAPSSMGSVFVTAEVSLEQRANELNNLHPTQIAKNMSVTAVGTGTNQAGEEITMVASSRSNLTPAQRAALNPNETPVSNKSLGIKSDVPVHAEQKIMQYMKINNITPGGMAASKPICPSCATVSFSGGATLLSPLKAVSDGTYVKPPTVFPPR